MKPEEFDPIWKSEEMCRWVGCCKPSVTTIEMFPVCQEHADSWPSVRNPGTHTGHCCKRHGCKYLNPDCPVVKGQLRQSHTCECCGDEGINNLADLDLAMDDKLKRCPHCNHVINDDRFSMKEIETAVFNHDTDGSDGEVDAIRSELWHGIRDYLMSHQMEVQGQDVKPDTWERPPESAVVPFRDLAKKNHLDINTATVTYLGEQRKVMCDRKCNKAWGVQLRPRIQLTEDPDDFVHLSDDQAGEAPANPGTFEGGVGKPPSPDGFPNKWCVRECERCVMLDAGQVVGELPDFSRPSPNILRDKA